MRLDADSPRADTPTPPVVRTTGPRLDVATAAYLDERRRILAERCERLLERWVDEDDAGYELIPSTTAATPECDDCP